MKALENYSELKSTEIGMSEDQPDDYDDQCQKKERAIIANIDEHLKSPAKGLTGEEKIYGLPIFWELIQDKTQNISNEILENSINALTEILKSPSCKHIRISYLLRAIENLIKSESIV